MTDPQAQARVAGDAFDNGLRRAAEIAKDTGVEIPRLLTRQGAIVSATRGAITAAIEAEIGKGASSHAQPNEAAVERLIEIDARLRSSKGVPARGQVLVNVRDLDDLHLTLATLSQETGNG